jgi:hypothetical protein
MVVIATGELKLTEPRNTYTICVRIQRWVESMLS